MVSSLSWATLPRQRINNSLSEAAARGVGVQLCCCCVLHCQLMKNLFSCDYSSRNATACLRQTTHRHQWDGKHQEHCSTACPWSWLCAGLLCAFLTRAALHNGEPSICSFTLFLGFHEHLGHVFGREYDFKSRVKCLIQPQMFTNTKNTP